MQIANALQALEKHDVLQAETIIGEVGPPYRQAWETRYLLGLCRRKAIPLAGHPAGVESVAFSPDGRLVACGRGDGTLRLWDPRTGRHLRAFKGHAGRVSRVAFCPLGGRIVSASDDKTVKVWDVRDGRIILTLEEHPKPVTAAAFSPDGKQIATGGDKTIRFWNAATGAAAFSLDGHRFDVAALAFSPDGNLLASVDRGATLKIWDTAKRRELRSGGHADEFLACVAFSPDGKHVVVGGGEVNFPWVSADLRAVDVRTGRESFALKDSRYSFGSVAFSPDGSVIASSAMFGQEGVVKIRDARTGKELSTLRGHAHAVSSLAFSPDGKFLVTGSHDGNCRVWDLGMAPELLSLGGEDAAAWPPATRFLRMKRPVGDWDRWMALAAPGRVPHLDDGQRRCRLAAFSPLDQRVVVGNNDGTLSLHSSRTGQRLLSLEAHKEGRVASAAPGGGDFQELSGRLGFSDDGERIVSIGESGAAKVWSASPAPAPPDDAAVWGQADHRWHATRAADFEGSGSWPAAAFHLERLYRSDLSARPRLLAALKQADDSPLTQSIKRGLAVTDAAHVASSLFLPPLARPALMPGQ